MNSVSAYWFKKVRQPSENEHAPSFIFPLPSSSFISSVSSLISWLGRSPGGRACCFCSTLSFRPLWGSRGECDRMSFDGGIEEEFGRNPASVRQGLWDSLSLNPVSAVKGGPTVAAHQCSHQKRAQCQCCQWDMPTSHILFMQNLCLCTSSLMHIWSWWKQNA